MTIKFPIAAVCLCAVSAAATPSLTGVTSRPDNSWFVLGEKVDISLAAEGLAPGERLPLDIGVFDEEEKELARIGAEVVADSDGLWRGSFEMPADHYGFYRVWPVLGRPDAITLPQRGSRPAGCLTYAVLPDFKSLPQPSEDDAFIGLVGGSWDMAEAMGAHYVLGYPNLASDDGRYDEERRRRLAEERPWARYGFFLANNVTKRDQFELFTEEGRAWMAEQLKDKKPGPGGKPRRMMTQFELCATEEGRRHYGDALRAFARRAMVRDYGFRRRIYEIFWEPELEAPSHEALVQVAQTAWEAIHAEDPDALCAVPTFWNLQPQCLPYLRRLLELGLGKYMDVFSVHPYAYPPEKAKLLETARTVKEMLRESTGRDVPMIATESSAIVHATREEECAARDAYVRAALTLLGEGFLFDTVFYGSDFGEDGRNSTLGDYGLNYNLELPKRKFGPKATSPRPMFPAFAAMAMLVDGKRPTACLETLGGTAFGYAYQGRDGDCVLALWDAGDAPGEVSIPVGKGRIEVADVMGNRREVAVQDGTLALRLSASPQYVVAPDLALWGKGGTAAARLAEEAEHRSAEEAERRPLAISGLRAVLVDGEPGVAADIENRSGHAVEAVFSTRIKGVPEARTRTAVSLPAKGRATVRAAFAGFRPDPFRHYALDVEAKPGHAEPTTSRSRVNFLFARRVPDAARLEDWPALNLAPLPGKAVRNAARHGGPTDCAASLGAGWNANGLLLEIVVDDDAFVQRDSGFWTWRGDCVQLGLARSASAVGGGNGWADILETACSEIDLALAPAGPEAYRTITFDAGRFPSDTAGAGQIDSAEMPLDVALEARGNGGIRLRYRAVVPWAFVNRTDAESGEAVWFAAQVNDRDAPDEDYANDIVSLGAFELKTAAPANFGAITLADAAPRRPASKSNVEPKLIFDGAIGRREDDPERGRYPDITALALAEGRVVVFRKYGTHARFEVLWLDNRPDEPAEPPMPGEANFAAVSIHGVIESAEARDGLKILFAFEGQEGGHILDLSKTEWIQHHRGERQYAVAEQPAKRPNEAALPGGLRAVARPDGIALLDADGETLQLLPERATLLAAEGRWLVAYLPERARLVRYRLSDMWNQ